MNKILLEREQQMAKFTTAAGIEDLTGKLSKVREDINLFHIQETFATAKVQKIIDMCKFICIYQKKVNKYLL